MRHYGRQLLPLLSTLVDRGGVDGLRPDAGTWERALWRATLRHWRDRGIVLDVPDQVGRIAPHDSAVPLA